MSNMRLVDAQPRASSSTAIAWVTRSAPTPPYSSGMPRAGSSISQIALNASQPYASLSSVSAARGGCVVDELTQARPELCCSSVRVMGCVGIPRFCTYRRPMTPLKD